MHLLHAGWTPAGPRTRAIRLQALLRAINIPQEQIQLSAESVLEVGRPVVDTDENSSSEGWLSKECKLEGRSAAYQEGKATQEGRLVAHIEGRSENSAERRSTCKGKTCTATQQDGRFAGEHLYIIPRQVGCQEKSFKREIRDDWYNFL